MIVRNKEKIVLMYHDIFVEDPFESGFSNGVQYKVCADVFEEHVKAIAEYCKLHKDIEVEFTFDDGGVSFLTKAAPILEKYGFRGSFFISTAYIGTDKFLSLEQVQKLFQRGHRIGSHTHTHPNMTKLSREEIKNEWLLSLQILTPFLKGVVEVSIPGGHRNKNVIQLASKLGVDKLYTSEPTTSYKSLNEMEIIGRYAIYRNMSAIDVLSIVSNRGIRLKIFFLAKLKRMAKTVLGPLYAKVKLLIFKKKYNAVW